MSVTIRRLCVYCGSNSGHNPEFTSAANSLGRLLAAREIELVYGGGSVGLMNSVADAVLDAGGRAIGVIPQHLVEFEVAHERLTELHVVGSMHERKALMAELSDGFVALPGGLGTFEELFEMLTWSQLRIHAKPVGVLNINGFYDPLLQFLDNVVEHGFVRPEHRALMLDDNCSESLLSQLEAFVPPTIDKWWTRQPTGVKSGTD